MSKILILFIRLLRIFFIVHMLYLNSTQVTLPTMNTYKRYGLFATGGKFSSSSIVNNLRIIQSLTKYSIDMKLLRQQLYILIHFWTKAIIYV